MVRERARPNMVNHLAALEDGRRSQHAAARLGYLDARAGRGFDPWYDDAGRDQQLAYEVGRHWATNIKQAGMVPPPWPANSIGPPGKLQQANVWAAEAGEAYATPWGVMPATDDPVELEPEPRHLLRRAGRRRR